MTINTLLTRALKIGSFGKDVDGCKRTVYRGLDAHDGGKRLKAHNSKPATVRRTFGVFFRSDVKELEKINKFPQDGIVTPGEMEAWHKKDYPDALAIDLMNQYKDEHKPVPPKPQYVEPNQGFASLDRSLYEVYTMGRNMGLRDLGTYNPDSLLPSGKKSDHAVYPAVACDLGCSPQTGWDNEKARAYFHYVAGRPEIHYVILGNKIWSEEKGLHTYTAGSHNNHVHVSGHRR